MAYTGLNPNTLTDAQARNLVTKSLRQARAQYRRADTAGESLERELDRLIKRKTRINTMSLVTLADRYKVFADMALYMQVALQAAYDATAQF
jgi:hypothetical protein